MDDSCDYVLRMSGEEKWKVLGKGKGIQIS